MVWLGTDWVGGTGQVMTGTCLMMGTESGKSIYKEHERNEENQRENLASMSWECEEE